MKNLSFITEKTVGKGWTKFPEINYTEWYARLLGSICQIKLVKSTGF